MLNLAPVSGAGPAVGEPDRPPLGRLPRHCGAASAWRPRIQGGEFVTMQQEYSAQHIQVLEGLEPVRKRPGMYVGSTGADGLHQLVYEVVDNSIDEAMAGFATAIEISIDPGNVVTVRDDGRGIPVDEHPTEKVSALEVVMTTLHAGGKFNNRSYAVSAGLHGVGVSVVNALSRWCRVDIHKLGQVYHQGYRRGVPDAAVAVTGATDRTGTETSYLADDEIFETIEYSFDVLTVRLRELAFLNKGIRISLTDRRGEPHRKQEFEFRRRRAGVHRVPERQQAADPPAAAALRRHPRQRRRGGGAGLQYRLLRAGVLLRQQRQQPRRRHPPDGLSLRVDPHPQRFREAAQAGEEAGREPVRRRRARGPDRGGVGQGAGAAVRGPDQGQARQHRGARHRGIAHQRGTYRPLRREPGRDQGDSGQVDPGRQGARGGAAGARADPAKELPGKHRPARQAGRLRGEGSGTVRAVHRGGRLGGRQRQAGPRPPVPGHSAAVGQDAERGEDAHRQGARQREADSDHHHPRHRRAGRLPSWTSCATTR